MEAKATALQRRKLKKTKKVLETPARAEHVKYTRWREVRRWARWLFCTYESRRESPGDTGHEEELPP